LQKLQILPALNEEHLTHEVRRGIGRRRNIGVTLLVLEGFDELSALNVWLRVLGYGVSVPVTASSSFMILLSGSGPLFEITKISL